MLAAVLCVLATSAFAGDGRFENATSAGQPSKDDLVEIAEQGYVAVIDLRMPNEDRGLDETSEVESLGMEYIALPIAASDGLTVANANTLAAMIEKYDAPVLVHCGSGNRVGALMALQASDDGASADEAIEIGKEFGLTRLEGKVREIVESTED